MQRGEIILEFANEPIFQWMAQFVYEPYMVYLLLVGMMALSAVGFPLPEEVTLLSVGFLAYMGAHPEHWPPPYEGAHGVNMHIAAVVAFIAVLGSDTIIYTIGRVFGRKILYSPRVSKILSESVMQKVEHWTKKYGALACGIFRFTPGLRFPGHLACGMLEFPVWKFLLIDGIAALISVPTQIYLIAIYGEEILIYLKQFKIVVIIVLGVALLAFLGYKLKGRLQKKTVA